MLDYTCIYLSLGFQDKLHIDMNGSVYMYVCMTSVRITS